MFPWICQIHTLHLHRIVLRNNRFSSGNYSFRYHWRTLKGSIPDFVKNFLARMSKVHSKCQLDFFEDIFFEKQLFWFTTFGQWATFSALCRKILDVVVKTAVSMSIGSVWGKFLWTKSFYHLFWTFSEVRQPSGKLFRERCQNSSLRVHRNILRRSLSRGKKFFQFLDSYRKFFGLPMKFFSTDLLKLHSTCTDEVFEDKNMENL